MFFVIFYGFILNFTIFVENWNNYGFTHKGTVQGKARHND